MSYYTHNFHFYIFNTHENSRAPLLLSVKLCLRSNKMFLKELLHDLWLFQFGFIHYIYFLQSWFLKYFMNINQFLSCHFEIKFFFSFNSALPKHCFYSLLNGLILLPLNSIKGKYQTYIDTALFEKHGLFSHTIFAGDLFYLPNEE